MKRLLSLLGAIGLIATTGATVVACGKTDTKTDVSNDVVTSQNYQVATQNLQSDTFAEGDLIASLEAHLRGYLNPLLLNLIGQNVPDINDDYELQGITEESIKDAIKAVTPGSGEVAQISGITLVAKDNAQYLTGEIELPPIDILEGFDFTEYLEEVEKIIIKAEDYLPTFDEVLAQINEAIAKATGELEKLKLGHLTFEHYRGQLVITGNGLYYGQISVKLDSQRAEDIAKVIIAGENNLGDLGFIKRPTTDQLFTTLTNKFGETYNAENLEIISSDEKEAKLIGRNMLKGEATVTYRRTTFDLANIANKNLGALEDSPTTKKDLIAKINAVNEGLGLTEDLVTIAGKIDPSDVSISIAAAENSDVVKGVAEIQWSIKQFDLANLIVTTDLGALPISALDKEIVDAVNKANRTALILDKDVKVNNIKNTGEGGRTATLTAVEGNPKYIGSVQINWELIADLTTKNIETAIKGLGQLDFKIKAQTSVADAKKQVTASIKKLLEEKYAVPEEFDIEYSEFPDEEFLKKPTHPNQPWTATDNAKMTFTLSAKSEKVEVNVVWRIAVTE